MSEPKRGRPAAGEVSTGRGTIKVIHVPDEMPEELFDSDAPALNASVPLTDLLATINAEGLDGKVIVEKLVRGAPDEWLFEGAPSGDLNQQLQTDYGAGRYRVRVYARGDDGHLAIRANKTITIGALPKSKEGGANGEAQPQNDRIAELIATMHASQEKAMDRFVQFMTAMVANKGGGMAEFKEFAQGLGALPKPPVAQSPIELLTAVFALAEKMKGGSAVAAAIDPETGDVSGNSLLLEALKIFGPALAQARGAQPAQAAPVPLTAQEVAYLPQNSYGAPGAPIHSVPANSIPQPIQQPQPAQDDDMQIVRLYIRSLVKHARASVIAPQEFSDQVCSFLTNDALDALKTEQWFETLSAIEPIPAELRPWFADLRADVLTLIAEESAAPETSQPAAPSKSNGDLPAATSGTLTVSEPAKRTRGTA